MNVGQDGDTRRFRPLRKRDYYEAKAAADADVVTRWPKCHTCGQDITGAVYGRPPDEVYCFRCWNET